MKPLPYVNVRYYTLQQIAERLGWTTHNVSQRSNLAKFERITEGVYTAESVDRYLLARELTERARADGYTARRLLWPDPSGRVEWNGKIYKQEN